MIVFDNGIYPQGVLSWVGRPGPGIEPVRFEARLYDTLFRSQEPGKLGDDWLEDLNPQSCVTIRGAVGTQPLQNCSVGDRSELTVDSISLASKR